jgi:hypothetical protein
MLDRLAAREMIDALAAVALGASALVALKKGPASPLRGRLAFVFGAQCLFYASRALAVVVPGAFLLALYVVCVLPLAGLLLAEGVLRRHAPRALKALVTAGALVTASILTLAGSLALQAGWILGAYVVVSLSLVTLLLLCRDRASLSRQENASVDALMAAGAVVTLSSVTDFMASAPVNLSGVGAASVAFVLAASPTSARDVGRVLRDVAVLAAVAAAAGWAFALKLDLNGLPAFVRLWAVLLSLLFAAIAVLTARRRRLDRGTRAFDVALAEADLASLDRFLESLTDQPLLADLRMADPVQLTDYDQPGLAAALASRPVWSATTLAEAAMADRSRDELADLMARTETTHAVMIASTPLTIALVTLPASGAVEAMEAHLALFGRLAAVAAKETP